MKSQQEVINANTTREKTLRQPTPVNNPPPARNNSAEYIRENVRKLGLWNSRTFRPIVTHDELGIVMAMLGFVGLGPSSGPGGLWKEYAYCGARGGVVRPRLPFPRVDGLHMVTYTSFLDSVNVYVRMDNVADVFHIRTMPLHRIYDRNERWRRMEDDEYSVFLYRNGTLEKPLNDFCMMDYQKELLDHDSEYVNSILVHQNGTSSTTCRVAPLEDIIVRPSSALNSKPENDEVNADTESLVVLV